jgi:hypothetical protein
MCVAQLHVTERVHCHWNLGGWLQLSTHIVALMFTLAVFCLRLIREMGVPQEPVLREPCCRHHQRDSKVGSVLFVSIIVLSYVCMTIDRVWIVNCIY